jgi:hypothetical protein
MTVGARNPRSLANVTWDGNVKHQAGLDSSSAGRDPAVNLLGGLGTIDVGRVDGQVRIVQRVGFVPGDWRASSSPVARAGIRCAATSLGHQTYTTSYRAGVVLAAANDPEHGDEGGRADRRRGVQQLRWASWPRSDAGT